MKHLILLFVFILSINIFSQVSPELIKVKQITNIDGDARNASFIIGNDYYYSNPFIFFEVHKDRFSNIYSLSYDRSKDEFNNPSAITNDSCLNLNPICFNNFLFYQTNKNGNWDIAYKIYKDSIWSETQYVAKSIDDEIEPVLFLNNPFIIQRFNKNYVSEKQFSLYFYL